MVITKRNLRFIITLCSTVYFLGAIFLVDRSQKEHGRGKIREQPDEFNLKRHRRQFLHKNTNENVGNLKDDRSKKQRKSHRSDDATETKKELRETVIARVAAAASGWPDQGNGQGLVEKEEIKDLNESIQIYNGFVMKELTLRILSRSVAQSNVLVVAPGMNTTIPMRIRAHNDHNHDDYYTDTAGDPGNVVIQRAMEEGHTVHLVPANLKSSLNQWWEDDDVLKEKAKWFLLAYFLPSSAHITSSSLASSPVSMDGQSMGGNTVNTIDTILHPSNVGKLLSDATLTYIVLGIRSKSGLQVERIDNIDNELNMKSGLITMEGLTAVQTLLDANYKVQLLASSHFVEAGTSYHPNFLFKTQRDVEKFLVSGAEMAALNTDHTDYRGDFEALLFATQGLDLAIPSRLSYLSLENLDICREQGTFRNETSSHVFHETGTGRCDAKLDGRALGQDVFLSCPIQHRSAEIEFVQDGDSGGVSMILDGQPVQKDESGIELWLGHDDVSKAEVACMRGSLDPELSKVSCTTRILRQPLRPALNSDMAETLSSRKLESSTVKTQYNVLSILIDPISRSQFQRSLPNTMALLEKLGFAHFPKYTVVGENSGPNQAALFTGSPLVGGRDGIKSSISHRHGADSMAPSWLWDDFKSEGYATLKAEDVCVENSNMVQSLKPKTTHGEQLYRMFCFDFDRPNCLGKDMAASHLIDYAKKFMHAYGGDINGNGESDTIGYGSNPQPWATFLSFVDSHEDSLTLISYLDEIFVTFLQTIDLTNTLVVFSSDHGLHYGPAFSSNGERERAEPILYINLPGKMHSTHQDSLKKNAGYWVTPFDVHETILDATIKKMKEDRIGSSLLKPLPDASRRQKCEQTVGIPERFCEVLSSLNHHGEKKCTFMPEPPSVLSFYADMPKRNRPSWPKCKKEEKPDKPLKDCLCATNMLRAEKYWLPCNDKYFQGFPEGVEIPLTMKTCQLETLPNALPQYSMEININVKPKPRVLQRHIQYQEQLKKKKKGELEKRPNILFIEIDSLSQKAASRHFTKTLALLESHRIVNEEGKEAHCPSGFCAAAFSKTSVVGQNSIPNQLAALSGCSDSNITGVDSLPRQKVNSVSPYQAWCPRSEIANPWIYNIAGQSGYTTFFGEEFCYKQSPYVVQQNLFKMNPDYEMNQLFCQLSQAVKDQTEQPGPLLYSTEHDTSHNPKPCVDGRSRQEFAFEYIRGLWNAYPEVPKFAYLNSLAAHDYSVDFAYQPLGLEAYDDYLSKFLEEILQRPDAGNTVIVLRSDHGLQGGPLPADFSFQVEHMNPFNNLIIPAHFPGVSLDSLFANQDKLVTGYDLYHVLREVMAPRWKGIKGRSRTRKNKTRRGIPEWSYNLLEEEVPYDRTCSDAKIPIEFCPCVEERTDLMPYFYIGKSEKLISMNSTELIQNPDTGVYEGMMYPGDGTINSNAELDGSSNAELDDV